MAWHLDHFLRHGVKFVAEFMSSRPEIVVDFLKKLNYICGVDKSKIIEMSCC